MDVLADSGILLRLLEPTDPLHAITVNDYTKVDLLAIALEYARQLELKWKT